PDVQVMAEVRDLLASLLAVTVKAHGGKPPKPTPYPRPETALQRVKRRVRFARHSELVRRVLPGRSEERGWPVPAGAQAGSAWIAVRPDLRGFHTQVRRELRAVNTAMRGVGREWGAQIQAGIKEKLKPIEVRLDADRVARQIAILNRSLDKLDGRRVSVRIDVDVAGSLAELQLLEQALARIDRRTANIQVNADIGSALVRLLEVE